METHFQLLLKPDTQRLPRALCQTYAKQSKYWVFKKKMISFKMYELFQKKIDIISCEDLKILT